MLNILIEIDAMMGEITQEDIARQERHMKPVGPGEKVLGVIRQEETRRLRALADHFRGKAMRAGMDASFNAFGDAEETELKETALRSAALHEMLMQKFWIAAKDEMPPGVHAWNHEGDTIGLREKWQLVTAHNSGGSLASLLESLGLKRD